MYTINLFGGNFYDNKILATSSACDLTHALRYCSVSFCYECDSLVEWVPLGTNDLLFRSVAGE